MATPSWGIYTKQNRERMDRRGLLMEDRWERRLHHKKTHTVKMSIGIFEYLLQFLPGCLHFIEISSCTYEINESILSHTSTIKLTGWYVCVYWHMFTVLWVEPSYFLCTVSRFYIKWSNEVWWFPFWKSNDNSPFKDYQSIEMYVKMF